jgi:hypothetical protein
MRKIKFTASIAAAGLAVIAIMLCGSPAQALPSIANVYPNGTNMFQPSATLTFTANSGTGVTNIVVDFVATNLYSGHFLLGHLTSASGGGLTVVGPNVSAPLSPNTIYGVSIKVYDASGGVTNLVKFDTISPVYTWEAEDWDFTSNSVTGQYIENPQVNQYAGLPTTDGVDAHGGGNGSSSYRPIGTSGAPTGLATEGTGDSPLRLQYIGTTNHDYDVGFTSGGHFADWTRSYPAGTYIIIGRIASGSGNHTECADLTVQAGNVTTTNTLTPFKWGVVGNGWQNYGFYPVTDSAGNPVQFTFDGNPATLRETDVQAGDNMQFFMLMPVQAVVLSTVTFTNVTPDGSVQFQASNSLSFEVTSPVAINLNSVQVQLSATSLFGSNSASVLSIGSGLSYTGNSTDIVVTASITTNLIYSALLLANDANNVQGTFTVNFDTIIPSYTFEGEDFNYGGGNYIGATGPNTPGDPPPDAYSGSAHDGVLDIDFHKSPPSGGAYGRGGLNCENANDTHRAAYATGPNTYANDYDIGNTAGGDWGDYTRTFPAGTYNIFVRVSRGNGGSVTDAGKISLVTSDPTQTGQTVQDLGKHNTPSTGSWQTYTWAPILNNAGFPARFVSDGTLKTLRYTFDGAGDNLGFVMLMPAVGGNPPPFVDSFTPDGTSIFQPSNTLTFVVNSSVGIPQGNVVLNLNGVNVSGLSFSGSSTLWNVSYPVKTNGFYTAVITLTDTAGSTTFTNTFSTFSPANYQWEAEDYDYSNGQYFDTGVDAYAGLAGVSGVDYFESDPNGPGRSSGTPYRPANGMNIPDTGAGDQARDQFTAVSGTDYSIGSFGVGSFANYTRHYPYGTYNVVGRFAEGAGIAGANLALLNPGVSTNLLGNFTIQNLGWGTWQWQELTDGSGNPVKVVLDSSAQTLRLGGTTGNEVNVNFLMLVATTPSPKLTATLGGGNVTISFATQTGYSYQVQYKNNLTDATWTPLGGPISGNNAVQSVSYSSTGVGNNHRFYQVQIQ